MLTRYKIQNELCFNWLSLKQQQQQEKMLIYVGKGLIIIILHDKIKTYSFVIPSSLRENLLLAHLEPKPVSQFIHERTRTTTMEKACYCFIERVPRVQMAMMMFLAMASKQASKQTSNNNGKQQHKINIHTQVSPRKGTGKRNKLPK